MACGAWKIYSVEALASWTAGLVLLIADSPEIRKFVVPCWRTLLQHRYNGHAGFAGLKRTCGFGNMK